MKMMTFPCTLFYFLELKILPVPEASVRASLHYHPRDLALPSLGSLVSDGVTLFGEKTQMESVSKSC